MTKEDIKQICQIYDNFRSERDAATIAYNSDDTFWEHILATYNLSQPSLPSDLDEAAHSYAWEKQEHHIDFDGDEYLDYGPRYDAFKAGAEWMAKQGWIDDGSMPPETKHEGNTMQAHIEWTESKPVLAWDSMYGPCVDVTKNGKWMSEQRGGYTGQVCHGIIAWRPIPEYKEKQ